VWTAVWTAPLLLSGLFVLSAFFLAATLLAARLALLATRFLTRLLAAGCAIVLRITAGGLLATLINVFSALLHTLISFSVVCHTNLPLMFSKLMFEAIERRRWPSCKSINQPPCQGKMFEAASIFGNYEA
jgi:hypothetical protein